MDSIIFWGDKGEAIIEISGADSEALIKIFDTPAIRRQIEAELGTAVDNTSEEEE